MYLSKFPKIEELLNKENRLTPDNDPIWEKLVLDKFDHVQRMRLRYPAQKLTPFLVAKYSEDVKFDYSFMSESHKFSEKGEIRKHFKYYEYQPTNEADKFLSTLSWRQLYLKLYLETYLRYFRYTADFKYLYNLLDIVKDDIIHLNLNIYPVEKLKSDYNYVRVVLSKLVRVKHLNIIYHDSVTLKMIKNIIKGINNFNQGKGDLNNLSIYLDNNISVYTHKDFNILTMIDKLPNLRVLEVKASNLDLNCALRIRNHLYYFKSIETLNLSNCNLGDEMAKEIADGIMKAKCLEKIYLCENKLVKGLASVLYNLAFQPSLKIIDISGSSSADVKETATALYKLIKMSQSLQILVCRRIPNLVSSLTNEFCYSLGDNSSIAYLDLTNSGSLVANAKLLGSAIAFNAMKNGALRTLNLSKIGITYQILTDMIEGMNVSEDLHFQWYGACFNNAIQKDSKDYYLKKFYCKLNHLDLSENTFNCSVNINDLKQTNNVNYLRILFENNQSLENINLSSCTVNKYFMDMIVNALIYPNGVRFLNLEKSKLSGDHIKSLMNAFSYSKEKDKEKVLNEHMHLEGLNLGNNQFGYSGIETISKMLKENKTLRILNLFHNLFDVNGARRLKDALAVNTSLEFLDISYNRVKDLGFTNIIDGILSNPSNKIQFLGCRYNFVKNASLTTNLQKLLTHPNSKVEGVELGNNSFDEKTINSVYTDVYLKAERKFNIEIFEILHFLQPERLERSVWISPLHYGENKKNITQCIGVSEQNVIQQEGSHLGIPLFITMKRGRKLGEKKTTGTVDAFIEFIHPNSANRFLKVAATGGFMIRK